MAEIIKTKYGKDKLAHQGFLYVFDRASSDGEKRFWRCSNRREQCSARVHTTVDNTVVKYVNEHNHDSDAAQTEIEKTYTEMKERAVNTQEVTAQVVQHSVQGLSQAVQGRLPDMRAMKKSVRRIRNHDAAAPPAPASLATLVIPPAYQEFTPAGGMAERFLLADSGAAQDRILIFGRNRNLDVAVSSERLYVDGTFKITPPLFGQVYVVLAERFGAAHPAVYALLPNKQSATYQRFFNMLKELRPGLDPQYISCDFELGALQAMETVLPNAIASGCFFHLVKNFKRQIGEAHLTGRYNTEADFAHAARMIPAVVFVPPDDLIEAVDQLRGFLPDELHPVLQWLENNYIGAPNRQRWRGRRPPVFPPQVWNCYARVLNDMPRTNNHAEAAHRRLVTELGMYHPTIWKFIDSLKKVQVSRDCFYEQLVAGQEPPKKKYQDCDRRIKTIVTDYANRNMLDYLRGLAHNFQMNP